MQIKVNESNEILYYSSDDTKFDDMTSIDSSVVPKNFNTDFKPKYFKFDNRTITVNSNYAAPVLPTGIAGSDGPTAEKQMINALGLQVASLQATVTKLTTTDGGAA